MTPLSATGAPETPPPGFAARFPTPYVAVIFTSQRRAPDPAYDAMAEAMVSLAARQPGYLGAESARGTDGLGITVSYWTDDTAVAAWRAELRHQAARDTGRLQWYSHYELRVARVERAYGWDASQGPADPLQPAAPGAEIAP